MARGELSNPSTLDSRVCHSIASQACSSVGGISGTTPPVPRRPHFWLSLRRTYDWSDWQCALPELLYGQGVMPPFHGQPGVLERRMVSMW